jgi:hypothetical protein
MLVEFKKLTNDMLETVRQWRNMEHVRKYMYTEHYITPEEHKRWFEKVSKSKSYKYWVITVDGKGVGLVNLADIDYENLTASFGFYLADLSLRGKGLGNIVLYHLIDYYFTRMQFNKLCCSVLDFNEHVIRMYRKFGFQQKGLLRKHIKKEDRFVNVVLLGMLREEWLAIREEVYAARIKRRGEYQFVVDNAYYGRGGTVQPY